MTASRRRFLGSLATAASLGICEKGVGARPVPEASGIGHIVLVMMENRSFDHFLGWVPGTDGKQAGLSYTDVSGAVHATFALAPDYTGCGHSDPDHSYAQSRVAYNNGAMDGFLRAGKNDLYTVGYYTSHDLPFFSAMASNYLICDRYFASILGPTFPNRMFQWTAQTDRLGDSLSLSSLPTIFNRLRSANVSHRYYFNNLPYLAFWGFTYLFESSPYSQFLADAAAGKLPAVSVIDPNFTLLDDGTGNDNHPHADVRNGEAFLAQVFHALATGPSWSKTVLIINFDEWGGFFDHVAPPRVVAPNNVDTDLVQGQALLGFRVPAVVASPFTRNRNLWPLISHTVFDHTSVLKLIEWRWNLQPLTARDASSEIGNFADVLNFASPDASVPPMPLPAPVATAPCFGGSIFNPQVQTTELASVAEVRPHSGLDALAETEMVRQWLEHPRFRQ